MFKRERLSKLNTTPVQKRNCSEIEHDAYANSELFRLCTPHAAAGPLCPPGVVQKGKTFAFARRRPWVLSEESHMRTAGARRFASARPEIWFARAVWWPVDAFWRGLDRPQPVALASARRNGRARFGASERPERANPVQFNTGQRAGWW